MDAIDAKLLSALQENADVSNRELAEVVGLSAGGVHKRRQRLRQHGYIKKICAILDRERLGLDLLCFLSIKFKDNMRPDNMTQLQQAVNKLPGIVECYTTTGIDDAILKTIVKDHNMLKQLLKSLAESQNVIERVVTSIALEEVKNTSSLPFDTD